MKSFLQMIKTAERCDELLSCLFGLNALENELYFTLVMEKEMPVRELATRVGKEQSVVYRAVHKLLGLHLCTKERRTMPRGGYYFVYAAREPGKVKEFIVKRMAMMEEQIHQVLEDFEEKVRCRKEEFLRKKAAAGSLEEQARAGAKNA